MSIEQYTEALVEFIRVHEVWAAPIVGALAFGESLAFISLLLPAWAMLVAIGALISGSGINFWPILVAGRSALRSATGCPIGSASRSGRRWPNVAAVAPSRTDPTRRTLRENVGRARDLHRALLRAAARLGAAGRRHLRHAVLAFQAANFSSAFVWAAMLLTLGDGISKIFKLIWA